MTNSRKIPVHESWAHLRFSVVGQLLAAPPAKGELRGELTRLAARTWRHPTTGEPVRFGVSTIERWYYLAARERRDPVGVLRRKVRKDAGQQDSVGVTLKAALQAQYAAHKSWSAAAHRLHCRADRNEADPRPPGPRLDRTAAGAATGQPARGPRVRRRVSPTVCGSRR